MKYIHMRFTPKFPRRIPMRAVPTFSTDTLSVIPWPDPVIDRMGHDPRSAYVETYWLGVLGPSTTWLFRHLARGLEEHPAGFVLPLEDCARSLGVGMRGGRQSPFIRAVGRLVQFEMAQLQGSDVLAVRRHAPELSRRHLMRLPEPLQVQHHEWQESRLQEVS
jgi:hypothetical protein